MLEISLSAVAAFAAYTAYAIVSDEIRTNRPNQKNSGKKPVTESKPKNGKASSARITKPATKLKASPKKTKEIKTEMAVDPIAVISKDILTYLSVNGPVTFTKITKELNTDKATVMLAAEKLIKENLALSVKRGGYPAIAPM